jgi:hypothetical protein
MYREIAGEEDDKMAERWQKDADGILIFVSSHLTFDITSHIKSNLDWFVLCCNCSIGLGDRPRPQTKLTGYIRILSREYLSTSRRSQHIPIVHSCHSTWTSTVLTTKIRNLGELTLVLELSYKS